MIQNSYSSHLCGDCWGGWVGGWGVGGLQDETALMIRSRILKDQGMDDFSVARQARAPIIIIAVMIMPTIIVTITITITIT